MKRGRNALVRGLLALAGALLIVQSLVLWDATGREGFTRYFSAQRAASEARSSQSDVASLFENTGVNEGFDAIELPPNRFAFGLLPSTYPHRVWDRHLLSVLTVGGPGVLLLVIAALPLRLGREPRTRCAPPTDAHEST